jgi:uncharacterized membrane-anchored protein
MAVKVPEVTMYFWLVRVLTTGVGETTRTSWPVLMDPVVAVGVAGCALAIALAQFRARSCVPWLYWAAVVLVSVFGTVAADVLHVGFGITYAVSTVFFAVALAAVFGLRYVTEKTPAIHSVTAFRRELCYWLAVVTTFALGTAAEDLTATTLRLGYLGSGVAFAVLIALLVAIFAFVGYLSVTR